MAKSRSLTSSRRLRRLLSGAFWDTPNEDFLSVFLFSCFDGFRLDLMWSEAAQNTYLAMCRNFNISAIL